MMTTMHAALVLVALLLPGIALAQSDKSDRLKVLTVCEILGDTNQYRGSVVVVVGRLYRSVSPIDGYDFLTQDRCGNPIVTKGFEWPNKILIWSHSEDGLPKPPNDEPKLDQELVARQLAVVRKTTRLGFHTEPQMRVKDGTTTYFEGKVSNQWALVYGRITYSPNLDKEPCNNDDIGCRGFMGAPIAIILEPKNIHILDEDGRLHHTTDHE